MAPVPSSAHFQLESPANWVTMDSAGGPQKGAPCGDESVAAPAGTPTGVVTALAAGQSISIQIVETIPHPGWYRVALVHGKSSTQTTSTLPDPPGTTCVPTIVSNPTWSPTQPIIVDGIRSGAPPLKITLPPNVTGCTSANPCTLQVVMVMTDHTYPACYYHHCADISIGASDGGATGSSGSGTPDSGADANDSSVAGGSSGAVASSSSGGGSSSSSGSTSSSGAGSSSSGAVAASSSGPAVDSGSTATAPDGSIMPDGSIIDDGTHSGNGGGCVISAGRGGSAAAVDLGGLLALAAFARRRRRS